MSIQVGLEAYREVAGLPELVQAAVELSREHGCHEACLPEVGRLLRLLASHQRPGRVGELGTALGVGAAWLSSGLGEHGELVTVEVEKSRAAATKRLFAGRDNIRVLAGDWRMAVEYGPFDLLFADGGPKHGADAPELLAPLLRPGGLLVMDDFTPESAWTPEMRATWGSSTADPTRKLWLNHGVWQAQEVQLSGRCAVILAVRAM